MSGESLLQHPHIIRHLNDHCIDVGLVRSSPSVVCIPMTSMLVFLFYPCHLFRARLSTVAPHRQSVALFKNSKNYFPSWPQNLFHAYTILLIAAPVIRKGLQSSITYSLLTSDGSHPGVSCVAGAKLGVFDGSPISSGAFSKKQGPCPFLELSKQN